MASVSKRTWGDSTSRKVGGGVAGVSWQVSWTDNGIRRKKSGFKTKAEAEAFAVERQKEVNDGLSRPAGHRMTLDQLVKEFLENAESRAERGVISAGHVVNMRGHFRNYICRKPDWKASDFGKPVKPFNGAIGQLLVGRIRPATVEKLRDDLLASGLSAGSVHQIKVSLHSALDFARRRDYIPANPADRIKIERSREDQNQRVTPPGIARVQSVIAAADGQLKLALEVSACTGIRAGELRALRYRHIDPIKRTLSVKAAISLGNIEGLPKSLAGIRSIPISPLLLKKIETHRRDAGDPGRAGLIFQPDQGWDFLPPSWLRYRLGQVLHRLGLASAEDVEEMNGDLTDDDDEDAAAKGKFTWHALRHFAISSWIAQGMGLKAVQTFAGHADVTTTWNRYGHLFPDEANWSKIETATELTLLPLSKPREQ